MLRRRWRYRRPIMIRPVIVRPLWRPFRRPLGCGMGLVLPFCLLALLLLAFVARHF